MRMMMMVVSWIVLPVRPEQELQSLAFKGVTKNVPVLYVCGGIDVL